MLRGMKRIVDLFDARRCRIVADHDSKTLSPCRRKHAARSVNEALGGGSRR